MLEGSFRLSTIKVSKKLNFTSFETKYIVKAIHLKNFLYYFLIIVFHLQLEKRYDKSSDTISSYWAKNGILKVEDLQISLTKSYDSPAYEIRSFTLKKKGNPVDRLIKHFHFTSWLDFGLPKNLYLFLSFIRIINKWNESFKSKKVSFVIDIIIATTVFFYLLNNFTALI